MLVDIWFNCVSRLRVGGESSFLIGALRMLWRAAAAAANWLKNKHRTYMKLVAIKPISNSLAVSIDQTIYTLNR